MKKIKKFKDEEGPRDPKRKTKSLKAKKSFKDQSYEKFKKQPAYKYIEEE